jgi:hypothetical protein
MDLTTWLKKLNFFGSDSAVGLHGANFKEDKKSGRTF